MKCSSRFFYALHFRLISFYGLLTINPYLYIHSEEDYMSGKNIQSQVAITTTVRRIHASWLFKRHGKKTQHKYKHVEFAKDPGRMKVGPKLTF